MDKRTLCYRCYQEYIIAGYILKRDYTVKDKEPCDKCGRMGWTYIIRRISK